MDPAVIVALIAAVSSLMLGLWNTVWTSRQKDRERRQEAKAELARYRTPLLDAAADLGARIHNIQHDNFDFYSGTNERRDLALKSTLYRFARYFAVTEILRSQIGFLEFEQAAATKKVAALLSSIEQTLTTDSLDQAQLMIWREEQRAVGEMSIERDGDTARCVGFATFFTKYDDRVERWFRRFQSDLETPNTARDSQRLAMVQGLLKELVLQLDEEGRYKRAEASPRWMRQETPADPWK